MKMSKRIFIVLLMVALVVSSLAFASSASVTVDVDNYDAVLEYYECPVLLDYNFSNEGVDYSDALIVYEAAKHAGELTHAIVEDPTAPGGKYLNIAVSPSVPQGSDNVYFNWNVDDSIGEVSSFFLNATVAGANAATGTFKYLPVIQIVVDEATVDASEAQTVHDKGTVIAVINFRNGTFSYLGKDANDATAMVTTDFAVSGTSWYDVSLTYNGENGVCSITLADNADSTKSVTVTDAYTPYASLKSIRFGVQGTYNAQTSAGNIIKLANLSVAQGSFIRDIANSQTDIEQRLLGAYALISDANANELNADILHVIDKVYSYGFTSDNAELAAKKSEYALKRLECYGAHLADGVEKYLTLSTYLEKRTHIDEYVSYAVLLENDDFSLLSEEQQAVLKSNVDFVLDTAAALEKSAADSVAFIAAMQGFEEVVGSDDYTVLSEYYNKVKDLEPDPTYEGVEVYYDYLAPLKEDVEDMESIAETFISAVNIAKDSTNSFVTRYANYLVAKENFFDNESYPGITAALKVYNDTVTPYMELNIELANKFITYVAKADYSIYISAKQENLDLALEYMDVCNPDFPGVAEAKVTYAEVTEYIQQKIAQANAYISAVNALDTLTGDALLAGIKTAQQLQEAGNVLGVDGVTEANIKLNTIVSELELHDKYCKHFLALVESLSTATLAEDKYNILVEAKAAEAFADAGYPGVAEASETLRKAINAYNIQVDFINAAFENASNAGVTLSGAGKSANVVSGHVIAIVKKVFDEE